MGQRSLVAYFGLVAWPLTETKSDESRFEEAAEDRPPGIVREQSAEGNSPTNDQSSELWRPTSLRCTS